MIKKLREKGKTIYFFCFFFLIIPSINLFSIQSFQIIKVLLFLLFLFLFLDQKLIFDRDKKKELTFFLFFFIAQLISIVNVINTEAYLYRAKDIIFFYFFYLTSLFYLKGKQNKTIFTTILLITSIINCFFTILLFSNNNNINIIKPFFHPSYIERIETHLMNTKIFWESYEEITIPLILNLTLPMYITNIYLVTVVFSALITNFRTRALMVILSIVGTAFFINKNTKDSQKKRNFRILMSTVFSLLIIFMIFVPRVFQAYKSVFNRFTLSEEIDYTTLLFRKSQWINSVELFVSHPLDGIGLGNYQDYSSVQKSNLIVGKNSIAKTNILAAIDPHNSFIITLAESGLLGLISKLLLIGFFIQEDIQKLKNKRNRNKSFIIAFWTLFTYSMFNPTDNITYNILFLSLRAVI